jgi:hypothetical protein
VASSLLRLVGIAKDFTKLWVDAGWPERRFSKILKSLRISRRSRVCWPKVAEDDESSGETSSDTSDSLKSSSSSS